MNNDLSSHPWLALLNTEELLNISMKESTRQKEERKNNE